MRDFTCRFQRACASCVPDLTAFHYHDDQGSDVCPTSGRTTCFQCHLRRPQDPRLPPPSRATGCRRRDRTSGVDERDGRERVSQRKGTHGTMQTDTRPVTTTCNSTSVLGSGSDLREGRPLPTNEEIRGPPTDTMGTGTTGTGTTRRLRLKSGTTNEPGAAPTCRTSVQGVTKWEWGQMPPSQKINRGD